VSIAEKAAELLQGMTSEQLAKVGPEVRRRLSVQLQRVYRIIEGDRILAEAQKATAPKGGVLRDLKRGHRAE
jgi:hypothetical protein